VDTRSKYQSFLVHYHAGVARDLPTISPFVQELTRQSRTRIPSLAQLIRVFETDPFLAAKLTGASNSVFFGHNHIDVLSVREALTRVGLRYAMNLVWEAPPLPVGIEESEAGLLWAHCMTVAHVARSIAAKVSSAPFEPDVAHLVAMIHDIGYLLQLSYSPNTWSDIAARLDREELDADNDPHASQGEELAKFWSLPTPVVAAIRAHHEPHCCPDVRGRWLSTVVAASELLLHPADPMQLVSGDWRGDTLMKQLDVPRELLVTLRAEALDVREECIRLANLPRGATRVPHLELMRTGGQG